MKDTLKQINKIIIEGFKAIMGITILYIIGYIIYDLLTK